MSYPLTALSHLIQGEDSRHGRVIRVQGDLLTCATPDGLVTVRASQPRIPVGARVLIHNGRAELAPTPTQSYPL